MAISEDLRSVQATLMQGLNLDNAPLLRLVCSNLQSIAEQIESLENLPLATRDIAGKVGRRRGKTMRPWCGVMAVAFIAIAVDDSN